MSQSTPPQEQFSVPSSAVILRYMLHALGIPAKASEISHKDLQRLGTSSLSQSRHERLVRQVINVIAAIDGSANGDDILREIEQRFPRLDSAQHWYANEVGMPRFDRVVVMRDLTEFLQRNQVLCEALGDRFVGENERTAWLFYFVIPFAAANLVEYTVAEVDWDSGMPGGRHWFLPQFAVERGTIRTHLMPSALILRWWQDALGVRLTTLSESLLPKQGPDSARRAIERWLSEDVPPSYEKVEQWAAKTWNYRGVFRDDPTKPLSLRWAECRAFLALKGMHADESWKQRSPALPSEQRVRSVSDGHPLELEVPKFANLSFTRFFEAADPIAEGLPVEELIQRVARRWAMPSASQLRLRLMIGCAMHRACRDLMRTSDVRTCLFLTQWFCEAYNVLLQHHLETRDQDAIVHLIAHHDFDQPEKRDALLWIYSEAHWRELPRLMTERFAQ